jgi:hypothetical protein
VSWLRQGFETYGVAPTRHSAAGELGLGLAGSYDFGGGLFAQLEALAQTHLFKRSRSDSVDETLAAVFTPRLTLVVGKRF